MRDIARSCSKRGKLDFDFEESREIYFFFGTDQAVSLIILTHRLKSTTPNPSGAPQFVFGIAKNT